MSEKISRFPYDRIYGVFIIWIVLSFLQAMPLQLTWRVLARPWELTSLAVLHSKSYLNPFAFCVWPLLVALLSPYLLRGLVVLAAAPLLFVWRRKHVLPCFAGWLVSVLLLFGIAASCVGELAMPTWGVAYVLVVGSVNTAGIGFFQYDKQIAKANERLTNAWLEEDDDPDDETEPEYEPRISERTLLLFFFLGGWSGAILAMYGLDHKIGPQKSGFRRLATKCIALHACLLVLWLGTMVSDAGIAIQNWARTAIES